jgi:zinc protease
MAAAVLLAGTADARAPAARAAPQAASAGPDAVAPDPTIRRGVLPNGMRYALQSHGVPKGAVSFRFRIEVGSIDEEDAERGVAHYVEHLAFSGGKAIPAGRMEGLFAQRGVAFGDDQNAITSPFETVYQLDLPAADAESLDLAFAWLRDVADGLDLTQAAVDRERGVVLEERRSRLDAQQAYVDGFRRFLGPELRVVQRDAIGTLETLNALDAPRARRFYERWYRPERAVLVVVGDLPLYQLQKRVETAFGSWKGKGAAPVRPPFSTARLNREFSARAWKATTGLSPQATLCVRQAAEPPQPDTLTRARKEAVRDLWETILTERLAAIAKRPKPPFNSAAMNWQSDEHEFVAACLEISPEAGGWQPALKGAYEEVRRFLAFGPTEDEVRRALAARLAVFRFGRDNMAGYTNQSLADFHLGKIARGDETASLDERYRAEAANGTITPEEVRDAFRADWGASAPALAVISWTPPEEPAMRAYWNELQALPAPKAFKAERSAQWNYADLGRPGRVVSREAVASPAFVRLTFSNGVVLNFKPAPFAGEEVVVQVAVGRGRAGLEGLHYFAALMGARQFAEGGFGRNSFEETRRAFPDSIWSLDMDVGPRSFELAGRTTPKDVEVQMQILAAALSDPGFRPEMNAGLGTAVGTLYNDYFSNPSYAASNALFDTITPGGPLALPPFGRMKDLSARDVEKAFRPALTREPFEVTVVGDLSEEAVVQAFARTLGALPPRKAAPVPSREGRFVEFPNPWEAGALSRVIRTSYQAAAPGAAVTVVWPLFVGAPERRREERALSLLTLVVEAEVRHRLREQMGDSYAPTVFKTMDDESDQGFIIVYVECAPERSDAVLEAVRGVAKDLAEGRLDAQQLEAVRKPVLAGGADRERSLDWWVNVLSGSARFPDQLEVARTWEAAYGSISLEEVRKAARNWLSNPGLAAIAAPVGSLKSRQPTGGKTQ